MTCGNSQTLNGHGSRAMIQLMPEEYMEQREFLLLQTIQEVDKILSVGLTRMDLFGCSEGMDMILWVLLVSVL